MPKDFSGQNLRGRSFQNQDLALADFSGSDIQGTDFSGANLARANFYKAKAGLNSYGIFVVSLLLFLVAGLSGFTAGIAITFATYFFLSLKPRIFHVFIASFLFICFVRTVLNVTYGPIAVNVQLVAAVAIVLAVVAVGAPAAAVDEPEAKIGAIVVSGVMSMLFVLAVALNSSVTSNEAFSTTLIGNELLRKLIKGGAWFGGVVGGLVGAALGSYVGQLALNGDKRFRWIWKITIAFASTEGTSFRGTDLTNANFTQAVLKSSDFRNAILTHTRWYQAKKLDCIRSGTTYLSNVQLQQWLINKHGQCKNFNRQDLRGVNLQGVNLANASFIGADLSHANLQDADLSRAKLVQTQLDGTDFTGATLTGAFIEDWGITNETLFDKVKCEYVFMRLPTAYNPDPLRKPDNRQEVFALGEFGDFIKPIFDTLDLYHNQGVDPRAIAISFKQLAENHPDAELEIVAMEKRGQDKFLLRAKTAIAADKSELSAEYFATYNQLKALAEQEVKALIAEKDSRIADLQNMVVTALQRPSFYSNVEQVGFMSNNPGGFSVGGSVSGDINNVQGENNQQRVSNKTSNFNLQQAQFGGGLVNADTVNAGQIGGNITNYNPEQKQNLAQAAAEIQQLLNQLSQSYPTATTLQRMTVVARAVDEIESNPTLKARVIGALKAGGTEAFKELIDHPLVNILLASIDGWQEAE
ncbi:MULTISPECIES: pentapeptide repeat-containing protein [Nostoc]|uniref:Pentapeptide repeat-containing protein n=1 Tax=Nostoc paludosum FACHB-159 TaxID=2692908 RepID=A0ABR8KJH9_9NOSO|nr:MULTISPECIES: pentapeptide repeat-containing protein [Nostoc]MBD2683435.1 pentapeptide repeat-containing protein [Nostoc sp. FACHB-857]MBD2739723.1 pentapeptide repeat-containing protein [Nostoc paludosum FACHB-159]